ncbi:hypothetical protein, partial [Streptomyces purpurogeneiscleroticus]|uniref:hypothetical protein n=1 Tax=Streptomyces purpurogeneiscleroticus TaxID=68259 RepID=UPI003555C053
GRYWSAGPQRALYVPGPCLREGPNEVLVLELEGTEQGAEQGAEQGTEAGVPRLVP